MEKTRRSGGVGTSAAVLLLGAATRDLSEARAPLWLLLAVGAFGCTVRFAPAPSRRRTLCWSFFAPAALIVVVYAAFPYLSVLIAPMLALLVAGGWLVLRGRSGLSFLALVAALFITRLLLIPVLVLSDSALGYSVAVVLVVVLVGAVAASWTAAALAPAETRRRERRPPEPASPFADAYPAQPAINPFAVAALVLGLVGVAVVAIVFGHVALNLNARARQGGSGMAIAGLVLGYVEVAVVLIWVVVVLASSGNGG